MYLFNSTIFLLHLSTTLVTPQQLLDRPSQHLLPSNQPIDNILLLVHTYLNLLSFYLQLPHYSHHLHLHPPLLQINLNLLLLKNAYLAHHLLCFGSKQVYLAGQLDDIFAHLLFSYLHHFLLVSGMHISTVTVLGRLFMLLCFGARLLPDTSIVLPFLIDFHPRQLIQQPSVLNNPQIIHLDGYRHRWGNVGTPCSSPD